MKILQFSAEESVKKLGRNVTIITKIILCAALALVLSTCTVMADTGEPQVPETQGFVTSTAMSAIGTVTETDSIVNIIANFVEEGSSLPYPLAGTTERAEYTSTYTENTIADQGTGDLYQPGVRGYQGES